MNMSKPCAFCVAALAVLFATPALAQVSVTSTYRSVDAHYRDMFKNLNEQTDSALFGVFNETVSVYSSTSATMDSLVTTYGLISASIMTRADDFFDEDGATSSRSGADMLIEFTVLSPSPYSLELFAEISEETLDPEDMFDFLLYSDSETILDYGDTWPVDNNTPNGFSGVMNVSTSGVLQPGTYTLEVDANSFDQFGGGSSFDGLPLDLDFTLTLPTPSGAALLALPLGIVVGRRRR